MSRAKEISERLSLQVHIQANLQNKKLKVSQWLVDAQAANSSGPEHEKENDGRTDSQNSFYDLPVIGIGSGLNLDTSGNDSNSNDISTIGEFIDSGKKVSSLTKKKVSKVRGPISKNSIHQNDAQDSRAMIALKRKMRKGHSQELRNRLSVKAGLETGVPKLVNEEINQLSSDDDEGERIEKTAPKSFGLLFAAKTKKKRK
ncbi:LAMI_0E00452g1_1 [Lachancea mirantina]|uniref:LAMI_0E00452g1_1 n=1 Tax=Lachancea mirantina TaxID=1230905 RepID=A0A1G4JI86_9SACH|nr:LAMI_0E00452g1_1 [Lachancea mirantina]